MLRWAAREFGLASIHGVGRNAYLIILARALRMFAFGATSFVLALFLNELGFSDTRIGAFFTLTLLGDVVLGTSLALVADRVGRRRVLAAGSALMLVSGVAFARAESFWVLLPAAIIGVVSATGGDFGPFRSIEESILSHVASPDMRADVLAWHVTLSLLTQAVGSEVAGRMISHLEHTKGWALKDAYHALFWAYAVMGLANAALVSLLTKECEITSPNNHDAEHGYTPIPQERPASLESTATVETIALSHVPSIPPGLAGKLPPWFRDSLGQISPSTRATMYKLWLLLALDSISDGMVPPSMTNYYVDSKFSPPKTTLGDAQSAASILGGIGTVFAGPLARRIGLINTMVFTHAPSSAAVLFFPLPTSLWMTLVLLFIRQGLNPMDQAPRAAFIAAVTRSEERTAVMGITQTVRTLAATLGPVVTGGLAGGGRFGTAFVVAGTCRLVYDFGLYVMFRTVKVGRAEDDDDNEGGESVRGEVASPKGVVVRSH